MEKKKVLICGIRDNERRNISSFFVSQDDGAPRFCEALVSGEGEAKEILSTYGIDEIIAIGSAAQLAEGVDPRALTTKKIALNEGIDLMTSDVHEFSDFDFLRYRLTQFVMNVDIDQADFLDELPQERRAELGEQARALLGEDLSQSFPMLFMVKGVRERFEEFADGLTMQERDWFLRYLFANLGTDSKMHAQSNNAAVPISFIPISEDYDFEEVTLFENLLRELLVEPDTEAELYVDLHGFSIETASVCASTLYALSDDVNTSITIRAISSVTNAAISDLYQISMQQKRYRTEKLMSGVAAFVNNGKTDILRNYWAEAKEANPALKSDYVDKILIAMGYVDAGISLSCIGELTQGIVALRRLLNAPTPEAEDAQEEASLMIMMVKETIMRDYGPLMDADAEGVDSFELVKWAYRKKFFQQVITVIESQFPRLMVERGVLYPIETEEERAAWFRAVSANYWDSLPMQRWMFKDVEHYFVKSYGRYAVDYRNRNVSLDRQYAELRACQVFGKPLDHHMLPAHSLVSDETLLTEFMESYYTLSRLRNSINHAEAVDTEGGELLSESKMWKKANDMIGTFIDNYQRVLDNIGDKTPDKRIAYTYDDLYNYFNQHGPREDPNATSAPGYLSFAERGHKGGGGKGKGGFRGGRGGGWRNKPRGEGKSDGEGSGEKSDSKAVAVESNNVTVTVSMPKSVIDDLKADKSKKGEICFRLSFE